MSRIKHTNSLGAKCLKCVEIIGRYPGFDKRLESWFWALQARYPSAHVSSAGRGSIEQEAFYIRGASKAKFGESAHNWGAALDLFELDGDIKNIYEEKWFNEVVGENIPPYLSWYGEPDSEFYELPHVQIKNWRSLRDQGLLTLITED